jgi:hypothetical protein
MLRALLRTLVDGYGYDAVETALRKLSAPVESERRKPSERSQEASAHAHGAEKLVAGMDLAPEHKLLLAELAKRFDQESAFPKWSDIRGFLLAHQQDATDLKGRVGAFKRMLPVLSAMSPKGLEKLIARSHHSGPADLGAISDAIRDAGEDLRGKQVGGAAPKSGEATATAMVQASSPAIAASQINRPGPGAPHSAEIAEFAKDGTVTTPDADGAKRPLVEIAALTEKVYDYVKGNPGLGIEAIGKALATPTSELTLPIRKLLATNRIRLEGERRGTKYFPM